MTLLGITIEQFHIKCGFCGKQEGLWDSPYELTSHLKECADLEFTPATKVAAKMMKKQMWDYAQRFCSSIDKAMEKENDNKNNP